MDDPISALDASTRKLISSNMLMKKLAKTARVPVTHAVDFTHLADKSYAIPDYTHLMASPDDSKKLLFQSGCSV
jgi:ABC-type lipoprotein export system ATPase subunit